MIIDERRVEYASAFLDGGDYAISKATRAGFTTSFVIAAARSNKRVLLVSPTKKIISGTMSEAADIVGIYGNVACTYNQAEIAKYPLLEHLPMPIPRNCDNCKYASECCILYIERNPDAQMISITAAKLEAIMVSDSPRALRLREIISEPDVVMFDEAHTLVTGNVAKLPFDSHLQGLGRKIKDFKLLTRLISKWTALRSSVQSDETEPLTDLLRQTEYDPDSWLIREMRVPEQLSTDDLPKIWGELKKLAKTHAELGVTVDEVLQLRDLMEILSHDSVRLSYITHDGTGQIYVCGAVGRTNEAIQDYLNNYARNAAVIFDSGTLYEPYPGFFESLVGRPVVRATFPDLNQTHSKMTVYADSSRLSGTTSQKLSRIDDIAKRIAEISEAKGNAPIHALAPNKELHRRLHKELHEAYPNIKWDYYRSANTLGVASDRRIIIAVGLAEVPKNAYDYLADTYGESQSIRVNSVDAATWQAWSRAKDPAGIEPSEVYCIGVKAEAAARVVTWGPGRRVARSGNRGYMVACAEELAKPQIMEPYKKQVHADQRKASPYIKRIWDASGDLTDCPLRLYELDVNSGVEKQTEKIAKTTYNNPDYSIRAFSEKTGSFVKCFGAIYANPQNSEQMLITAKTLDQFFRSKQSHHAEQQKQPNARGMLGYRPHITRDFTTLVSDTLDGHVTPATYGMGEDGKTVQCAFDIDNHAGTNPALPRVIAAINHIKELGAQPVPVSSGSADSYHVHIPIVRAPIETSHDFIKTVHSELKTANNGLDFKHDTEIFPKQGKKNSDHPYGNALKLPLAVNNKTGQRAKVLADSLEPVDVVFITKVAELRQPEKEAERVGVRQYLPVRPCQTTRRDMRPCVVAAINQQLNGSSGHDMRVAIVCEALASGKSREETTELFSGQNDFDQEITAKHVDYIVDHGYRPWNCETLQQRCAGLVDCANCLLASRLAPQKCVSVEVN